MAHHKRKRARKQTVGCPCCHIPKDNSAARTKPKDRLVDERPQRIVIADVEPTPEEREAARAWFLEL